MFNIASLILIISDLSLTPISTLEAYCRRATIETLFNTQKKRAGWHDLPFLVKAPRTCFTTT